MQMSPGMRQKTPPGGRTVRSDTHRSSRDTMHVPAHASA